ncbi:hypothetical protein [uncultured Microbulbifer sp.]|uniref:hypothetical protein n=1 Tax=uncultured Microbulbifer sp. TaxID=348147 RepID=UPI00261FB621|nr:hypothetical protein [uncultured Microbulbifer sp.]
MSWIFEVFSEKSDQARLVAILISAVVAVMVVLLNQWFLSRRAKRELLIEKIEEIFTASNEYIASCRELLAALNNSNSQEEYYEYPEESVNKLNDSITKIQMICGLYFNSESFNAEDFRIWRMPILEIAHKGKILPEGETHMAYEDSKIHIHTSREKLDDLCKSLMRRYGH